MRKYTISIYDWRRESAVILGWTKLEFGCITVRVALSCEIGYPSGLSITVKELYEGLKYSSDFDHMSSSPSPDRGIYCVFVSLSSSDGGQYVSSTVSL